MTLPDSFPRDAARIVDRFAELLHSAVDPEGLYVGGSLATGDFHSGISDFDLVAVVRRPLTADDEDVVRRIHLDLIAAEPLAGKLHCVYVPIRYLEDVGVEHPTWAHQELFPRILSGVARAELLAVGVTVFGPDPAEVIPPMRPGLLDEAVRNELTGYWTGALGKRRLWLHDLYVDLGLLTLARAQATLRDGRLITKAEAMSRLPGLGVNDKLADEIKRRRDGHAVPLTPVARVRRAQHARRVMADGIALLATPDSEGRAES